MGTPEQQTPGEVAFRELDRIWHSLEAIERRLWFIDIGVNVLVILGVIALLAIAAKLR
jgi:hypothetical protein